MRPGTPGWGGGAAERARAAELTGAAGCAGTGAAALRPAALAGAGSWAASWPAIWRAVLISRDLSSLPPHSPRSRSALLGSQARPPTTAACPAGPSAWDTSAIAALKCLWPATTITPIPVPGRPRSRIAADTAAVRSRSRTTSPSVALLTITTADAWASRS